MENVTLIFPDTYELSDFLQINKIACAEVNSSLLSLTAELTDDQIINAYSQHNATLKKKVQYYVEDWD